MQHCPPRHTRADEAALEAYFRLRTDGQTHQRALSAAIVRLIRDSGATDGRDARARVISALRSRGIVPADREDWILTAVSSDAWRRGARAAILHLSAECRRPFPRAGSGAPAPDADFDMIGAGILAAYLRAQMPAKIARLRREVMRLFEDLESSAR